MRTLVVLLILTGLSLPAYAAREEGATELSSVSSGQPDGYEAKQWTQDSFAAGNPSDVIELVNFHTRPEGRSNSPVGSKEGVKTAQGQNVK